MVSRSPMWTLCGRLACILVAGGAAVGGAALRARQDGPAPQSADAERVFATRIWPVLAQKCLPCHGGDPKLRSAGLDLGTRAAALRGGDSRKPALVPGNPEESLLYLAVARRGGPPMPPKDTDRLARDEVESIRQWIAAGAPWPDVERLRLTQSEGADGVTVATSGGLSPEWTSRR